MAEQKKSECKCDAAGATESRSRQWAPARRQEREQKTVVQQQQLRTEDSRVGLNERTKKKRVRQE
jgi:hypothetical protein